MKGHKRGVCREKNECKPVPISQATPPGINELENQMRDYQRNPTFVQFPTRM